MEMTSTGVERTQESALKEGRSEKNREKIKDGIGRNICASKLLECTKVDGKATGKAYRGAEIHGCRGSGVYYRTAN